jgi:hypothetical protein
MEKINDDNNLNPNRVVIFTFMKPFDYPLKHALTGLYCEK